MKNIVMGRRGLGAVVVLALVALVLPLGGHAFAAPLPTMDVEPEESRWNQFDTVTFTATLSAAAPKNMRIHWENENGPNDPDMSVSRQSPDRNCTIPQGTVSCFISYTATRVSTSATNFDRWRAWVDQDFNVDPDLAFTTDDSDQGEARNEQATPGDQPQNRNPLSDTCSASGSQEPDCTDVVEALIGAMEIAPDVQTLDSGATARLTARMFAPAQQAAGINIDFENESGPNDPDSGTTRDTPDRTCTVPQGQRECFVEYPGNRGTDTWRGWIDTDNIQTTFNGDGAEGRWSGGQDCQQPEDPPECTPGFPANQNPAPGEGCNRSSTAPPDNREPDCTDVVSVSWRSGPVALLDCDDRSGAQSNNDTERETNPPRPSDTRTGDPSTERYKCTVSDQFGSQINGIQVKAEVENGINDPDPVDAPSYDQEDYRCTTTFNEDDPPFLEESGVCFISITQNERELGTAEVCFWVGTGAEGQSLCGDEPTGENQQANGTDPPNDLADQIEKTWEDPATFRLDCEPETDRNPAGTRHEVTCTVRSSSDATIGGVAVDAEATGTNDPDTGDTPVTPDFTCTTGEGGRCTFSHTGGSQGTTTYRAWVDADNSNTTNESDANEGRDEAITPGTRAEPDNTDVVEKTWTPPPSTVTITPQSDSARVGECNPYTVTVTDSAGAGVQGAVIDAEQRHERADNQTQNDEPTVSFCEPPASAGPNPSGVDESRGDLRSGQGGDENPDNPGTAGGETTQATDQNGKVTIGIRVAPGNGSNGSGNVAITVWWETDDNDDPATAEPKATASKTWTPAGGEPGVPAGLSLTPTSSSDEPGEQVTYTATVNDANGDPVEGATVAWSEDGEGEFVSQESETNANGQARATVTSNEEGTQTITATASGCAEGADCSDSSAQVWEEQRPESCPGHANDSRNQIVGTSGNDVLRGTDGDDVICGLGGKDTLIGRGGDDLLLGGNDNDILRGNAGRDTLRGQRGEDTLAGGGGNDKLFGQADDDILRGGGGNDTMRGGGGKDVLRGRGGNDRLFGGRGDDNLNGGRGRDVLDGGPGRDVCRSGDGRDRISNCE